jgi:hypothetical protein
MSSQTLKVVVCGTTGVVLGAVASGAVFKLTKKISECIFDSSCTKLDNLVKTHPCLVSDTTLQVATAGFVSIFAWCTFKSSNCVIEQLSNLDSVLNTDNYLELISNTAGTTMNVLLGSNNIACGLWLLHDSTKTLSAMNFPYCETLKYD